ncbi:hypothetical protein DJ79_09245 [Halorubrum ezzemoulense]|uniref:Uncharacterized protein n=1 Tax=Halorubrum ezzemoulense TaxID=337243 RepID=A0A256JEQ5_HALEZ|nr:hypothetical protein [Halorubrum ezzemoulense]OYR67339.1 hypothetical protein DJ79_09245 [Halorubrum ezzemoulense]
MSPATRDAGATDGSAAGESRAANDARGTDRPLPTVVGVAGPRGSGKTSLIERLVDAFAAVREAVDAVDPPESLDRLDGPGGANPRRPGGVPTNPRPTGRRTKVW